MTSPCYDFDFYEHPIVWAMGLASNPFIHDTPSEHLFPNANKLKLFSFSTSGARELSQPQPLCYANANANDFPFHSDAESVAR